MQVFAEHFQLALGDEALCDEEQPIRMQHVDDVAQQVLVPDELPLRFSSNTDDVILLRVISDSRWRLQVVEVAVSVYGTHVVFVVVQSNDCVSRNSFDDVIGQLAFCHRELKSVCQIVAVAVQQEHFVCKI